MNYWSARHVHDVKLIFELFHPIVQVFGHPVPINGMIHIMLVEDIYEIVSIAMELIDTRLLGGRILSLFCMEEASKKKLMKKTWKVF